MPKTKVPRGTSRRPDPEGEAWQAEAAQRWRQAEHRARNAGGDFTPIEFYDPPALPVWSAPEGLRRAVLGQYLHDRETDVMHRVATAADCDLDAVKSATFYHFAAECEDVGIACSRCLPDG